MVVLGLASAGHSRKKCSAEFEPEPQREQPTTWTSSTFFTSFEELDSWSTQLSARYLPGQHCRLNTWRYETTIMSIITSLSTSSFPWASCPSCPSLRQCGYLWWWRCWRREKWWRRIFPSPRLKENSWRTAFSYLSPKSPRQQAGRYVQRGSCWNRIRHFCKLMRKWWCQWYICKVQFHWVMLYCATHQFWLLCSKVCFEVSSWPS